MRQITITGPYNEATERATLRYEQETRRGRHTVLDGPGIHRNSMHERRRSAADVLITVTINNRQLSETTTNARP